MLDSKFERHLDSYDLLTINYICFGVETSYMSAQINNDSMIDIIHSKGYNIVLALPERYEQY